MSDEIRARLEAIRRTIEANERPTPGPILSEGEVASFEQEKGARVLEGQK